MANRYISAVERLRAQGLLDMMYTPSELAWETGIDEARIKNLLPTIGMPNVEGGDGQMWIHGVEFAAWVQSFDKQKKVPLQSGEAYCLRCRQAVPLLEPTMERGYMAMVLKAGCPRCQGIVYRAIKGPRQ